MNINVDILLDAKSIPWQRVKITRRQYQDWHAAAAWDLLHGQRLGQSFCNFFNVKDSFLYYCRDDLVIPHIKRCYLRRRHIEPKETQQ